MERKCNKKVRLSFDNKKLNYVTVKQKTVKDIKVSDIK